jgi:uncharacterized LabA/DUF88 family protein
MSTAILIDGGFFLKRYRELYPEKDYTPQQVASECFRLSLTHLSAEKDKGITRDLYRIFFYDCPPLAKKVTHPITGATMDFANTPQAQFRRDLHDELRKLRKVVLRQGELQDNHTWIIKPARIRDLLSGKIKVSELTEYDMLYDVKQKGVDIRIGLDIASLAYKKQADQIVLFAGDSDFVPAAKLARREGIDFILDPMWNPIHPSLHEHIDGLRSTCRRPPSMQQHYYSGE